MIKEYFLTCALAISPLSFGSMNLDKNAVVSEYKWIHDILEKSYPGNEFFIIHKRFRITPPGNWERIKDVQWNSHVLYRRPKKSSVRTLGFLRAEKSA